MQVNLNFPDVFMKDYPAPKPKSWLESALEVTTQSRQKEYGNPLINFLRIAIEWNLRVLSKMQPGKYITPIDVAWMMIGTKVAREIETHKDDNGIDTIGYASCHDRIDQYMRQLGYRNGSEEFNDMDLSEMVQLLERITHEPLTD